MKFNLQEVRKRAGFKSAAAFANHIGMNVGTYTNYEQGKRKLTLEQAWEFADELDCTLDELAGRDFHPPGLAVRDPFEVELVGLFRSVDRKGKGHILDDARGQSALSKNDGSERPEDGSQVTRETA